MNAMTKERMEHTYCNDGTETKIVHQRAAGKKSTVKQSSKPEIGNGCTPTRIGRIVDYIPLAATHFFNVDRSLDITRSVDVDHVLTDHHDDVLNSALGAKPQNQFLSY